MAITLDGTNCVTTPDLTVDTNTLHVDSANNRVGIGTGSPTTALTLGTSQTATVQNGGSVSAPAYGIVSGAIGVNGTYVPAANTLGFVVGGAERGRFTANGLTFNGDTAAANALDDYEEGQWDAEIFINSSSAGITYSSQYGSYVKIGSYVYCWFDLTLSSKGSNSGNVEVRGLPFASSGGVEGRGVFSVSYYSGFNSLNSLPFGRVEANSTRVIISGADNTGATNSASDISNANLNNGSRLQGMITIYSA